MACQGLARHYIFATNFCRFRVQADDHLSRYPDPKRHSWINQWSPTHVVAELRRIEVEKRFAPKKVEIKIERFEVNLGKDAIIKFLNELAGE